MSCAIPGCMMTSAGVCNLCGMGVRTLHDPPKPSSIPIPESRRFKVYDNLLQHLAARYRAGEYGAVAELCDGTLDRTGALLGEVRLLALRTQPASPEPSQEADRG